MAWFKRSTDNIKSDSLKKDTPDGIWTKCPDCNDVIHKKQWEANLYVCSKCGYHFRIGSEKYFQLLLDEGSFRELDRKMKSIDPLNFSDTKPYVKRIEDTINKTGLYDAIRTGTGKINNIDIVIGCMDFDFIGGSMGSVVGEKISRAIDKAIKTKYPLIILSSSGGARMMEGAISLMQLAKTSTQLAKLSQYKVPYISILTNPTTGGASASYAMLGDFNIAEPNALIAFAGPRVVKQATGKDLPPGFQRAEFVQEHGFIDFIVERKDLKSKLTQLLNLIKD
ncbi:MAG: acetyl-CoA carboxylase, carboxyltransferase subunit beta [Ignavibacteriaceae bacterium]|jgi:acetyl-CoA carboxylase carboxyl transferase subunit beta|nr:MAG: acetyl-CoA carboxylase carboxyltransferase subunit beta [Chlorobiota bacterium]KXK04862.1 MAG: acetyl-CoA carboxylase subunit beta [Chlorobi bacterium OLB4]MBV6397679.1 Acetyl-coenzyme A carboxylase carboxyl transferase subunit beta [Ignavibacteria bacterium]MCC6885459.1 acetyl-CoA carboxylase carboxyltransferase subunit beta [Ignavibacteriales bacterium]MCE7952811.1 acetyl-CoA carboxylase carboxyltransferase subunit beta [Chlorobi bacterium CHB7]MDL1887022.1 acetyl-CoA carboxylase car